MSDPKILIVDDSRESQKNLELMLADLDVQLYTAESGEQAILLTGQHSFALFIIDIIMPVMDGFELASRLRNRSKTEKTPIIFVTAFSKDDLSVAKGYDLGAVDYVFLPVNPGIFSSKVKTLLMLTQQKNMLEEEAKIRIQLEASLQEYAISVERKKDQINEIINILAHDVKTPLSTLGMYCHILRQDLADRMDNRTAENLSHLEKAAERLESQVSELLRLAKSEQAEIKKTLVLMETCVNDSIRALEKRIRETNAKIVFHDLPEVNADATLMTQLYQNLIGNALKYRASEKTPSVELSAEKRKHQWVMQVKDNGIGIPDEHLEDIFLPFKSFPPPGKRQGTGIGLAICKNIVERHNGKIWVESIAGEGSSFFFTLPR